MKGHARGSIDAYLALSERLQQRLRVTKATDSRPRRLLKHLAPVRFRGTARLLLTDAVAPVQRRRASKLELQASPLLLHLGSGGAHKDGWVNIDLVGDPVEVAWDLSKPLPFRDGSAVGVFHEHVLEHLPLRTGMALTRECLRVLRPGGVLRVGVPDAGRLLRSYLDPTDGYLDDLYPDRPTHLLAAQELFYWHRHCTMYDLETLTLLLLEAGFSDPTRREFGESDLPVIPDTESRRRNTLYVEARRPAGAPG